MKRLWLGLGPDKFDRKKDILSGPWCVQGKEHLYPDLNSIQFIDDPMHSLEERRSAETLTRNFAELYLKILAEKLNSKLGINHIENFWRIMLMPWLLTIVQITWLKQKLINDFIKANKNEEISVELIDNSIKWNFEDNFDFMLNGVQNVEFSHWLFSRLIENKIPKNWRKKYRIGVEEKKYSTKEIAAPSIKAILADKLIFFFPLLGVSGINIFEAIFFQVINKLKIFRKKTVNNKINHEKKEDTIDWDLDWDSLIENIIPKNFLSIKEKGKKPYRFNKIVYGTAAISYYDFKKRLKLALSVERGAKLIGIQHGGAYGTFAVHSLVSAVEYANSYKFLSWGWEKTSYQKEKIIPVSFPYLSKIKYNCTTEDIIFVNGIFGVLPVRINSFKQPNQVIKERNNNLSFIKNLDKSLLSNFYYRPSFSQKTGGPPSILDGKLINNIFPSVKLIKGDLHARTMKCKLLILNQPGTTFNIAMSANIPTISFWNPEFYEIDECAKPYFEALYDVGIIFDSPHEAAIKANNVWGNIDDWWQSKNLQNARREWAWNYARSNKNWRREWFNLIWNDYE